MVTTCRRDQDIGGGADMVALTDDDHGRRYDRIGGPCGRRRAAVTQAAAEMRGRRRIRLRRLLHEHDGMGVVPGVIGVVNRIRGDGRCGRVVACTRVHRARQKAGWLGESSREPDPPQGDQRTEPQRASHRRKLITDRRVRKGHAGRARGYRMPRALTWARRPRIVFASYQNSMLRITRSPPGRSIARLSPPAGMVLRISTRWSSPLPKCTTTR
jgi:hypothetical protein